MMESDAATSKVTEVEGDLFDAPDGAALIHACNCHGAWGKGIARAFSKKYPAAFATYESHCQKYLKETTYLDASKTVTTTGQITRKVRLPEGTALIIPPQKEDYEKPSGRAHWIICLFTSRAFGRRVSSAKTILENTELAVADMKRQLQVLQSEARSDHVVVTELRACRFNSGLFGVEWAQTRKILEESGLEVTVVRLPEQ